MKGVIVTSLAIAACAALAGGASAAPRTGVLTGQVLREATTIQCVRAPCLEPGAGLVLTILRDGLLVTRPRTDAAGRFRLSLLPGRYAIRHPRLAQDRLVRVEVGGTVRVEIRLVDVSAQAVG